MITEPNQDLMTDQTITASAASAKRINLGAPRNIAMPGYWVVQVGVAFATCDSIKVDIQCHEDTGFSTGTRTIGSTGTVLTVSLTANAVIGIIPAHVQSEQYVQAYCTVGGSSATTGTLNVFYVERYPFNKDVANA